MTRTEGLPDGRFVSSASEATSAGRAVVVLGVAAVLAYPAVYSGMYAGDALIHLTYAENAAKGHLFEFNLGEKSSGVTSPGYMLLLAALFKLAPAYFIPVMVKALNLAAWYALVLMVYLTARRVLGSNDWAFLAALTAGLLPGSAYNATIGMENGLFALAVMLFLYLAARWKWLYGNHHHGSWRGVAVGVTLGAAAWLRPEGLVVGAIALGYAATMLRRDGLGIKPIGARLAWPFASFAALAGAMLSFHMWMTGDLVMTSGVSRVTLSAAGSIHLGAVPFTPRFSERLLYYAPLTASAMLGAVLLVVGKARQRTRIEPLIVVLFCVFFVLYSTILSAAHLARYVIFLMPMLVVLGAMGARWLWAVLSSVDRPRVRRLKLGAFALGGAGLTAVFAVETNLRRSLGSHDAMRAAMNAPAERTAYSDRIMAELGNPAQVPVSLLYEEVQVRYHLDDRFVIRSLDGRVDKKLLDYVEDGNYDHMGYVRERGVHFIMETANYNRDSGAWSLSELTRLELGEELARDGVILRRLPDARYRVVSISEPGQ